MLSAGAYRDGGRLYWRVGAIDTGGNIGAYSTGSFVLPRGMRVSINALLRRGKPAIATITVKNASNRAIRGARVTISGVGIRTLRRTTNRKGVVRVQGAAAPAREAHGDRPAQGLRRRACDTSKVK